MRAGPWRGGVLAGLALGWLAGVAVQLQRPELLPAPGLAALLALAAALLGLAWGLGRHAPRSAVAMLVLAAALAGFGSTDGRAQARLAERLPAALEGRDLVVAGIVAQLPRQGLQGPRFVFEVESANATGVPPRLLLHWHRGIEPDALLLGPAVEVRAGQRWRFTVRLRQPHGNFNPHGFDAELWLFEQGVGATGYVRSRAGDLAQPLAERAGAPVERARQAVRDAIARHVDDGARAGVLAALAVGDQGAIERDDWALFRDTGIAHLMSISGLHVTMFAWLAAALLGWLWRRSPRLMLWLNAPLAARWGGVAAAAAYALLAGWGVPAQRTVVMLAVVALLRSAALRWPLHAVLLAAALAVVALDPWALLQPGFWLSFAAVGLLAAAEPALHAALHEAQAPHPQAGPSPPPVPRGAAWAYRLRMAGSAALRQQAVATVGLAPLSLVFFQQLSLVGFVANLVAIPLVTLVITPLALGGMLWPWLWQAAAAVLQGLAVLLHALAAWPGAVWTAAAAPPWAVAAGLLGAALAVLPLPWRLRALALPLLLPLLAPPLAPPPPGRFELVAADVGQGTAVLVRTRRHLLVYDSGPGFSPEADAGGRLLLPLLRARGERRIDRLMLSHRDSDHTGGAAALLAALPVAQLHTSLEPDHELLARGVPHQHCEAGQSWQWDGVDFQVLHPTPADRAAAANANALSCVLRIAGTQARALLTGDLEAAGEAALLARAAGGADAPALRAELLLVPHHGSRTSSSAAFIAAVAPRMAVVQAGYRSRYGHPAPEVLARYAAAGVAVARSDQCGALTLAVDGAAACAREAGRRYWHHQAAPGAGIAYAEPAQPR
ncbi:MAG: DNA internalization-related competence protein ComEC/Rec2 [Burkholderiaceae bacterium]|nr:DNA internalization-related competence protein ComEC/Rec2 [Burkholderiaceae bacterium]